MADPISRAAQQRSPDPVLGVAGDTHKLLRNTDWAATPLGPISRWPDELTAAVRTVLPSRIPMLLWWGPDLIQVYNEPFTAMLGRKHPRSMGQPAMECWSEIWDIIGPMAQSVLDGNDPTYSENLLLFLDRHGYVEETYWTFSHSPIRGKDGKVAGIFVATTDVTAQTVAARRARSLAELDAAKTRFFQNISHEFRTPLTLLLGPLQALLEEHAEALPAEQQDAMRAAHRAALRLQRMVDALLTVAQGEANQLRCVPEPTNLARLTADCASMFRSAVEQAGLELVTDIGQICGPVMVDRDMWTNIVLNLLSNAVKFTHTGTISVRLSVDETRELIELAVADTGMGIPDDELPHVFDRFHRVPTALARSREGSGIGLSLVADLTKALGGATSVRSAVGRGSTFTVTIPHITAAPAEPRALRALDAQASPFLEEARLWESAADSRVGQERVGGSPGARTTFAELSEAGRVLLVEDNADLRAYLQRLFIEQGWTVDLARHGREALARAEAVRPDLVLADVMMPEMDGIALLEALRADPGLSRVPVVLLTARAGPESAIEGLQRGADDYVVKPFDPAELVARVRVHLELAQLRELLLAGREREAGQLRGALETRTVIGQAVGLVMSRQGCDSQTAFDLLARASQHRNIKVRELAREIVDRADARSGPNQKRPSPDR